MINSNKFVPQLIFLLFSLLVLVGCQSESNSLRSLSLNSNGSRAFYINYLEDKNTLYTVDLKSETARPTTISTVRNPSEVIAGEGEQFSVISYQKQNDTNGKKYSQYFITKHKNASDIQGTEIIKYNSELNSGVEIYNNVYAFKERTDVSGSARSGSKFFAQGIDFQKKMLSNKTYGYRLSVSAVRQSLVFLSGETDAEGKNIPDVIPIHNNMVGPYFPTIHFSRDLTDFGCDRMGNVCFSISQYTTSIDSRYRHKSLFTQGDLICKPDLPFNWIEFPIISNDGRVFIFLTTEDGDASPINVGRRLLIVVSVDLATCKFITKKIELKGY